MNDGVAPPLVELPAAEGATDRAGLVAVLLQLCGLLLLMYVYEVENPKFFAVTLLAVGGFVVHAIIRDAYRPVVFVALSVASVLIVLGLDAGSVVLAIGTLLIVVCHLPLRYHWRLALVALLGIGLAMERAGAGVLGVPDTVWPVLASMFMFRMMLYLHALRKNEIAFSPATSLSYFFMLPNACFPLFPVVDYETFVRSRFDQDALRIYDQGIRWIWRGVTHLLCYRVIAGMVLQHDSSVVDMGDLMMQLPATFLLYLQVSGRFHLAVGILHLFGYRLPETHHYYLLSSSVTDAWRRINIYWKDFIMKLVWYPSFFRFRAKGTTFAVATATLAAFAATWVLHSYQYFWVRGTLLLSGKDAAFWAIFGVLATTTAALELRTSHRLPTHRAWRLSRATSVVTTMTLIIVLWSFWSAESTPAWLDMVRQVRYSTSTQWMALGLLIAAGVAIGGYGWGAPRLVRGEADEVAREGVLRAAGMRLCLLAGMCALTLPPIRESLPSYLPWAVDYARGQGEPWRPAGNLIVGYYEKLTPRTPPDAETAWRPPPPVADMGESNLWLPRSDFLYGRMPPSARTTFSGEAFTTNRWGMRDRERDLLKPQGTFRIALIGPSDVMGWGTSDREVFSALVETRLDARARGKRVEVLNFALAGWSLPQQVFAIAQLARPFSPDLVLLTVHPFDADLFSRTIRQGLDLGIGIPDSGLTRIVRTAAIAKGMSARDVWNRLTPLEHTLDRRTMEWAAEEARSAGANLGLLALSFPSVPGRRGLSSVFAAATESRIPISDCSRLWGSWRFNEYSLRTGESHPNAAGHRLIAECLEQALLAPGAPLPSWLAASDDSPRTPAI